MSAQVLSFSPNYQTKATNPINPQKKQISCPQAIQPLAAAIVKK
jgi:hypothetical protein